MQLRLLDSAITATDARHPRVLPTPFRGGSSATAGEDRMRLWRPLPRKVMDVICGEGAVPDVPLHSHEAMQVLLPASRFAVVDGTGRRSVVHPGVIYVTRPLDLLAARSLDGAPCAMRLLLVAPDAMPERREVSPRDASPASHEVASGVVEDPALYAELWALFEELRRPLVALECGARLHACLSRLVARQAERASVRPVCVARPAAGVERAREHIRARATESVSLDELATVAGLSKFYLLRAFRHAYGLTPHAYQMQLRLARARRLIAEGRPLSYVTYDAGFADQSHLTRRFAAFFGLTPARYARQLATPVSAAPRDASVFGLAANWPPAA